MDKTNTHEFEDMIINIVDFIKFPWLLHIIDKKKLMYMNAHLETSIFFSINSMNTP